MPEESKGTILNVDDSEAARHATARILKQSGFEVIEAGTGREAIRLAMETQPDLIILAINLPDIDGFEVVQALRADPGTASIPIVHLSATYRDTKAQVRGLDGGADGYLTQPVEPPVLVATIGAFLRARRAESKLTVSARQWQTVFDATSDGICMVDREGKIRQCNRAMAEMIGKTCDEMIGSECSAVFPEEFLGLCRPEENAEVRQRRVSDLSANDKWFHISVDPLLDEKGELVGVISTVSNITQLKQLEAERIKASKLESIGVLAGGIAHDFNNILTAILGNITLAKLYSKPTDKIYDKLVDSERACLRAKDLTGQLFAFSKGGGPVKKTVSIDKLIKDTALFAVRGSNVQCRLSIEKDLWPVDVDESQIAQVINNIVINAEQAMPGGGTIEVTAANSVVRPEDNLPLKDGPYVKISVEDHGTGISREHLSRVFDPYFTTKQEGSGLGLTVSYAIVKNHNGFIDVESDVGVGTTFHVFLPASVQEIEERIVTERGEIVRGKGKILVMEDEELVRVVIGHMLAHLGYSVEYAGDGKQAIEQYLHAKSQGNPFDAVIMDLTIPGGMGGREAIRRLRDLDSEVKAVVSSGYSNDPIMSDYENYGFKAVIAKPYRIEDLSRVLHEVVGE
ncbi:MAG: response regulator [Pseudomonadota bacterium]